MLASRRRLLLIFSAAAGSLFFRFRTVAQTPVPRVRPPRSPAEPSDETENGASPLGAGSKAMLEQRQKDIKKEVERLYKLASELKDEVEKTDATTVLSLAMVKKADEIEKLAKQIKDNAKG